MDLEDTVESSKKYLVSDTAFKSIENNFYWPKWNSPLWHMLALWEIGKANEIPHSIVDAFVENMNRQILNYFPIKSEDIPPGTDPYRQTPCHCQLGTTYQLLSACQVDVDDKMPWIRPWFLKYQLSDGGLNCDETHYSKKNGKSSIVSTLPCLEAILRSAPSLTQDEIEFLDKGAAYLIKHRLIRRSHNEELMDPRFAEFIFPRFYEYDILRGLSFLADWATLRKITLPYDLMTETLQFVENKILNNEIKTTRSFGEKDKSYNLVENEKWSWQTASTFPLLEKLTNSEHSSQILMQEFLRIKSLVFKGKGHSESCNFNLQPYLTGDTLKVVPLKPEDFESLYSAAADPLIWEQHPQSNRFQRSVFEKYFESAISSGGAFAIVDKSTEKIVGSSRYYNYKPEQNQITIGYTFLSRSHWGGKFNQEMKYLMLKHAFQFVDRVIFEIGEMNLRSRRAIEKLGAQLLEKQTLDKESHVIYYIDKIGF